MIIAVAYDKGEIYGHFGHCEMFALYEYGETVADCAKRLVPTEGRSGHQAMADLMREHKVDAVICGHMGSEAVSLLLSYGILPVPGYSGHADTAADLLVTGQLPVSPGAGYGGGCGCGDGGCGCGDGSCGCGDGGCGDEGCGCGGQHAW